MARESAQRVRTELSLRIQAGRAERQGLLSGDQKTAFLSQSHAFIESVSQQYTPDEQTRIFSAMRLMTKLHVPQEERPDHTSYISHPLSVAASLVENMQRKDADVVVAALLHDAVEDQGASLAKMWAIRTRRTQQLPEREAALAEVGAQYGARVRSIVSQVSNPDFDAEVRAQVQREALQIEEGSTEFKALKVRHYQEHFLGIIGDEDAFLVKLSDFASNALTIDDVDDARQRAKYIGKYGPLIPAVLTKLGDSSLNLKPEVRQDLTRQFTQAWERMGKPTLN